MLLSLCIATHGYIPEATSEDNTLPTPGHQEGCREDLVMATHVCICMCLRTTIPQISTTLLQAIPGRPQARFVLYKYR